MKRLLLLMILPLSALQAQGAGSTGKGTVAWFRAEGNSYFLANGYAPNSGIRWCADSFGCKPYDALATVNAAGNLRMQGQGTFKPAFALSDAERGGNGCVNFLPPVEFNLESVRLETVSGAAAVVTWKATTTPGNSIVYEVLKAAPGADYSVAATYRSAVLGVAEEFRFPVTDAADGVQYRLRVRNEAAGERYLTKQIAGRSAAATTVYPTVVQDAFNIANAGDGDAYYTIVSADGKVVASEKITDGQLQVVPVRLLPSGNYIVSVKRGDGGQSAVTIVKK